MSSKNSKPSTRRSIICHAVETDTVVSPPCARHLDPAVLVGLSLAYARQSAAIPAAIAVPLTQLADQGNPTCRLVVDWLGARPAAHSHLEADQADAAVAAFPQVARSPRQRAMEGPGGRGEPKMRPERRGRSRARFGQNAIIAATGESR